MTSGSPSCYVPALRWFKCQQPKFTGQRENFLLLGGKCNWHLRSYLPPTGLPGVSLISEKDEGFGGVQCRRDSTSRTRRSSVSADLLLCATCGLLQYWVFYLTGQTFSCSETLKPQKKTKPLNKASEGKYKTTPGILSKTRKIAPPQLYYLVLRGFWTN